MTSRRLDTLTGLAAGSEQKPLVLLTTVNGLLQRVPPRHLFEGRVLTLGPGGHIPLDRLQSFFRNNGYIRTDTVREPGEFAVRGGIVDLFPAGAAQPIRLDFFGDTVESLRSFDPLTQRSTGALDKFVLRPVSEILLDDAAIERFRSRYREQFGAVGGDDPLYESVSAGRRHAGMEHWLPLYYETLETLFDYLPQAAVSFDYQANEARRHRLEAIADFYAARHSLAATPRSTAPLYRPVRPEQLFLDEPEWAKRLGGRAVVQLSPFALPEEGPHPYPPPLAGEGVDRAHKKPPPLAGEGADRALKSPPPHAGEGGTRAEGVGGWGLTDAFDAGARLAKDFAAERANPN